MGTSVIFDLLIDMMPVLITLVMVAAIIRLLMSMPGGFNDYGSEPEVLDRLDRHPVAPEDPPRKVHRHPAENCVACGAPMPEDAEKCEYCGTYYHVSEPLEPYGEAYFKRQQEQAVLDMVPVILPAAMASQLIGLLGKKGKP